MSPQTPDEDQPQVPLATRAKALLVVYPRFRHICWLQESCYTVEKRTYLDGVFVEFHLL
jgi:hypothetical protein